MQNEHTLKYFLEIQTVKFITQKFVINKADHHKIVTVTKEKPKTPQTPFL